MTRLSYILLPVAIWAISFAGWANALYYGDENQSMQWLTIMVLANVWIVVIAQGRQK